MSVKSVCLAAALALTAVSSAQAATITFESATPGLFAFGTEVEDGFVYRVDEGGLLIEARGNPGNNISGYGIGGGGVLRISAEDDSLFTFAGLDYAAFGPGGEAQFLWVTGWRDEVEVGFEFFLLDNALTSDPSYPNWTTFAASGLKNLNLDALTISFDAGDSPAFAEAVDNIVLGPTAVPEPSTWALMITGFGLAGAALRRGRRAAAVA